MMRFLPQIASEDKIDWVSSKGFSYGYIGGGLQFAITLGLVAGGGIIGVNQGLAARIGLAMAGLWWAGFTLFTLKNLKEAGAVQAMPEKLPIATQDSCLCRHWNNANYRNN